MKVFASATFNRTKAKLRVIFMPEYDAYLVQEACCNSRFTAHGDAYCDTLSEAMNIFVEALESFNNVEKSMENETKNNQQ